MLNKEGVVFKPFIHRDVGMKGFFDEQYISKYI